MSSAIMSTSSFSQHCAHSLSRGAGRQSHAGGSRTAHPAAPLVHRLRHHHIKLPQRRTCAVEAVRVRRILQPHLDPPQLREAPRCAATVGTPPTPPARPERHISLRASPWTYQSAPPRGWRSKNPAGGSAGGGERRPAAGGHLGQGCRHLLRHGGAIIAQMDEHLENARLGGNPQRPSAGAMQGWRLVRRPCPAPPLPASKAVQGRMGGEGWQQSPVCPAVPAGGAAAAVSARSAVWCGGGGGWHRHVEVVEHVEHENALPNVFAMRLPRQCRRCVPALLCCVLVLQLSLNLRPECPDGPPGGCTAGAPPPLQRQRPSSPPAATPPRPAHLLCVVVPYRDVWPELREFVPHMHAFLGEQGVSSRIVVVNQTDGCVRAREPQPRPSPHAAAAEGTASTGGT